MLKRVLFVVVAIALVIPLGLAAAWAWDQASPPAQAQTPAPTTKYNPAQTITVVGQGSARVAPDIAQITIGVETSADTVAGATQENETQMKALLAALKAAGILEKEIKTSNYSISVNRSPEPKPAIDSALGEASTPTYTVSNMVTVTIRKLDLVGDVIDAAVEAGANSIWGINFTVEKTDVALAEARTKAVADAKARAEALAGLGGVKLGPVMAMSEVVGGGSIPVAYDMAERAMGGGTSISPGEVEISYQLQIVYYIEP